MGFNRINPLSKNISEEEDEKSGYTFTYYRQTKFPFGMQRQILPLGKQLLSSFEDHKIQICASLEFSFLMPTPYFYFL